MSVSYVLLGLGLVCIIAYVISRSKDARLIRNGVFLATGLTFLVVGGLLWLAARWQPAAYAAVLLIPLFALAILVTALALIGNGVIMLRREGRSLGNQLSLLSGVLLLALPVIALLLLSFAGLAGFALALILFLVSAYFSFAFVSFALYSVMYGRMRHRVRPAAIVIHGSGILPDGTLPPLLKGRTLRALRVYTSEKNQGRDPLLLPSGGKGDDEVMAEARAMALFLRQQNVPESDILIEDRSRTTRENIQNSLALLKDAGVDGGVLLVTSDYHVLRTASLARRLGTEAHVVGARSATYFIPSAFIREFVAILVQFKWVTIAVLTPFIVLIIGALAAAQYIANTYL